MKICPQIENLSTGVNSYGFIKMGSVAQPSSVQAVASDLQYSLEKYSERNQKSWQRIFYGTGNPRMLQISVSMHNDVQCYKQYTNHTFHWPVDTF